MHVYVEVRRNRIDYEVPASGEGARAGRSDRVILLMRDEFARERAWSISAVAPGPVIVRACEVGSPWKPLPERIEHVAGVWRETQDGYAIELRAPMNLFGTQLAALALDRQDAVVSKTAGLGWLHTGSEALRQRLEQYAPQGVRVSVVDAHGWLLARAGFVSADAQRSLAHHPGLRRDENDFMRSAYRVLFSSGATSAGAYGLPYGMWGPPVDSARAGEERAIWFEQAGGEPSLVRAAVPVRHGEAPLGALVVEQAGEQLVLVRELALTRLLNLTLVATLFSVVVTLVFAMRLSHRIRRLSRAASTALTTEGRIEPDIPGMQARDELGALARNYATLLARLKEYTSYLQTLGTKLSHELRTPLTIVSSSLENLGSEYELHGEAHSYLERARSGAHRMHSILTAMSEATRVEQSIEHTERVRFDLAELVRGMGEAYRQSFAGHRIETRVPQRRCIIEGSADLIAQLLDKLMDNAADFAPPGALIALSLDCDAHRCVLEVLNEGPLLPPHLDGRLFESLVSGRGGVDGKPHLGLGLYIVRLITDFHGGTASAANLPDGRGVAVSIELPRPW
jgi:signal transduction histidine kinase